MSPLGQTETPRCVRRAAELTSIADSAIDLNFAVSASPSDNSIARRHAAMTFHPLHYGHTRPI